MDGLKRYVNGDRFRVDGDKNMRLLAFAFTIVFVWTGPKIVSMIERARQGVIMLKSRISLKLCTIDGCGEILTSTKNKVAILNSLGFTGTPPENDKIYSFLHN